MRHTALGLALTLYCALACAENQLDWSAELGTRLDYRLPAAERGWAQQKLKGKLTGEWDTESLGRFTAVARGYQDFYYDQARFDGTPAADQASDLWLHELYWRDGT